MSAIPDFNFKRINMRSFLSVLLVSCIFANGFIILAQDGAMLGFSGVNTAKERSAEGTFDSFLKADNLRGWLTTTPRGRNWVWQKFAQSQTAEYEMIRPVPRCLAMENKNTCPAALGAQKSDSAPRHYGL